MKTLMKPLPLKLPERFDTNVVEAAKGILILLVILGHASNFWTPEPFATFSIKFFHVACFLLLPFIYDVKPINGDFIKDRMTRYYVPYAFFLLGYSVLYLLVIRGYNDVLPWLGDVGKALVFGNAPMLDAASGLRALWFLPVLIALVFLNAYLIGNLKFRAITLIFIGFVLHVGAGAIGDEYKFYLPFGLVSAAYLLWLGFVIRFICVVIPQDILKKLSPLFLVLAMGGIWAANAFDTLIKFPVMALPDIHSIYAVLIHDVIIVSMFLFLLTTSLFKASSFLIWCGKNSLTLYLTHLVFLAAFMQLAIKYFDSATVNLQTGGVVLSIFVLSCLGAIACVFIINKWDALRALIMPRSYDEWPLSRLIKKEVK